MNEDLFDCELEEVFTVDGDGTSGGCPAEFTGGSAIGTT
jgi:hypothetical protein